MNFSLTVVRNVGDQPVAPLRYDEAQDALITAFIQKNKDLNLSLFVQ